MKLKDKPLYSEDQLMTFQNNARHLRNERNETIKAWFKSLLWIIACIVVVLSLLFTIFIVVLYCWNLTRGITSEFVDTLFTKWITIIISAVMGILGKDAIKETFKNN
ncbi:MAG: hypothetical protein I8H80_01985 [Alphaproteobacteria bacterium]|nr:hypothetical protein [Alphaproteobacteria bacterium]